MGVAKRSLVGMPVEKKNEYFIENGVGGGYMRFNEKFGAKCWGVFN